MTAPAADVAAAGLATAVALACTAAVAGRAARGGPRRAAFAAWTGAFAVYAAAAGALLAGATGGWDATSFRIYYLCGAILVVPLLAVGELLLVAPARAPARLAAATVPFLVFAAAAAVLAAHVDGAALAAAGAAPPNDALDGPWPQVLAVIANTAGTAVLLAGSLLSARRRRALPPLLVAAGVVVLALTSSATRLGSYELFAAGQAAGLLLLLAGIVGPAGERATRRARPSG